MSNNLISILENEKLLLLNKLHQIEGLIELYNQYSVENKYHDKIIQDLQLQDFPLQKSKMSLDKYFAYDSRQPIRKKILDIIKNENRFLHVREIANIAHQFENDIPVATFIKKISPALSVLKTLPETSLMGYAVSKSHFNTFWGSRAWLNEEGEIKREHMYNTNQLSNISRVLYKI